MYFLANPEELWLSYAKKVHKISTKKTTVELQTDHTSCTMPGNKAVGMNLWKQMRTFLAVWKA